jgi:hypothetical protein|tara:strand:- start:3893 stop:4174 length:282 start_codon:yes stop_codon:yes gene_type:complete
MSTSFIDTSSLLIVIIFLTVLIAARQIIVSSPDTFRKRIGPIGGRIKFCETHHVDKSTKISLYEIDGQSYAILHGGAKTPNLFLISQLSKSDV